MNVWSFVGSVIAGCVTSSAFTLLLLNVVKERYLEKVKAEYTVELESFKDALQREQKVIQAKLDQGTYVTRAQYDLELASYRELWTAMSNLRNCARSILGIDFYNIPGSDNEWRAQAIARVTKAYKETHNAALEISERHAPFYEKGIQQLARHTTSTSSSLVNYFATWTKGPSDQAKKDMHETIGTLSEKIEQIDGAIRSRLTNLRVL